MGCMTSAEEHEDVIPMPGEILTAKQKRLVEVTWSAYKQGNYVQDVFYAFVILFKEKPESFSLFDFLKAAPTENDMLDNKKMEFHIQRIVNTIGLVVDNMNDPDSLVLVTTELGRRHVGYGAKPEYFASLVNGLVCSLRRKLGQQFTEEVQQAWVELLSFIGTNMVEGMRLQEEELRKRRSRSSCQDPLSS